MKAWRVAALGEPKEVLELVDVPDPGPGPDQIVVRVLASPANFPDVLMCRGLYQVKPDLPFTPGVELCGTVIAVGSDVTRHKIGDRVLGMSALPYGGFAELAVLPASGAYPAPDSLDDVEAASLFVGYQTSWCALHRRASVQPGQTLLVHAAAGGVGSSAVQLGKAAGARVIAVVGGPDKAEVAKALGADVVVDRRAQDFVEVVKAETGGLGADLIYDPVGGETYDRSTKCIAFEGSILVIGFAGGTIQKAALNHALVKNYSIVGLHWGLYNQRNPQLVQDCHDALCTLADQGLVKPLVSERLTLAELADGVQRLGDGVTVGRVAYQA